MSKLQKIYVALLLIAVAAIFCVRPTQALIQSQRDQIGVTIVVNVTPSPIAYVPHAPPAYDTPIIARFALRAKGARASVDATALYGESTLVAQSTQQKALKVEAEVTPNPSATLLTSNLPSYTLSGTAGSTITVSCAYQVQVDTTQTSWTLREGLSNDFSGATFPGDDLKNNSYPSPPSSPNPSFTPFLVYPSTWSVLASSGGLKNYCIDLSLTIPGTAPGGTYSTNAVYTLYF